MKNSLNEDVLASFPHPVLPTVQGEPDHQTIHATRKLIQANSRAIDTHLGGGTLDHLGIIISDAAYAMIAPATAAGPTLWTSPPAPGRAPANTDVTVAQISAARHIWEEDVQTYRTCTVKLLPLPQPPLRARTDVQTNPSAQRATQLRSVLARVYAVARQNQFTTTVP
jgi:hypothetical protein